MRQVVLDTETTGLEPQAGHRVIEIGGVEVINRRLTGRHFHQYLNPDRDIDEGALQVHGISREFLADKPRFGDVLDEFLDFIDGAELVIHNAPFDVAFIDAEFERAGVERMVRERCMVLDTLAMARQLHPGQRNTLDALCKRYEVDNSQRELHGALLDAEILADVFLAMTGGQTSLELAAHADAHAHDGSGETGRVQRSGRRLRVVRASDAELRAHMDRLTAIDGASDGCLWLQQGEGESGRAT